MRHLFVWKLTHPEPEKAQLVIWDALERAMTYDRHMTDASVTAQLDGCLIKFRYQGRDRWWVKARARTAVIALAVRAKVSYKNLELLRLERVDSGHDLKKPNRTEPQQVADYQKTRHYRWARLKAQREANSPGLHDEQPPDIAVARPGQEPSVEQ